MNALLERRVRALLEADPARSDRSVGREAGVSANAVGTVRRALVERGLLPPAPVRRGDDGRVRQLPGAKGRPMVNGQPLLTDDERAAALETIKRAAANGSVSAARWLLERDRTGRAPEPNTSAEADEVHPPDQERRSDLLGRLQRRKEAGAPRHRPPGEAS